MCRFCDRVFLTKRHDTYDLSGHSQLSKDIKIVVVFCQKHLNNHVVQDAFTVFLTVHVCWLYYFSE